MEATTSAKILPVFLFGMSTAFIVAILIALVLGITGTGSDCQEAIAAFARGSYER